MFVFFGLVAVLGTQYVQADRVDWVGLVAAIAVGSFSSAVLVANNLRDIDTDPESGKLTLAVRLGDTRTRLLHLALMVVPFAVTVALVARTPWALVALIALPLAARANKPVRTGETGFALIPALRDSGLAMLVWGLSTGAALAFA